MRWDELRVEEQERRSLPGLKDPAVVRHFDAPEALETTFYEIRAKSAINRVPERSRNAVPLHDQPVPGMRARMHVL